MRRALPGLPALAPALVRRILGMTLAPLPPIVPIELYYSPYCTACSGNTRAEDLDHRLEWIYATTHLEAAARLRIVRLPALVVDGKAVVQGRRALQALDKLLAGGGEAG